MHKVHVGVFLVFGAGVFGQPPLDGQNLPTNSKVSKEGIQALRMSLSCDVVSGARKM